MTKERPILFNGEMVRAIFEGRKTQTRRVVKPQPFCPTPACDWYPDAYNKSDMWCFWGRTQSEVANKATLPQFKCPYGKVGDRLWVRETWQAFRQTSYEYNEWEELESPKYRHDDRYEPVYKADNKNYPEKWLPSIFMPREFSRITLEIANIRVERLQDISNADAQAEGIHFDAIPHEDGPIYTFKNYLKGNGNGEGIIGFPIESFKSLWQSINGQQSWDDNPWVWVVEFKQVES